MNKPKFILFIEDDPDDQEFFSELVKKIDASVTAVFAGNGFKALEYLAQQDKNSLPCLVVLDLNMPFLDGKETYKRIKNDERFNQIQLVIFTSSHNPHDKKYFEDMNVEFISKPDSYAGMNEIVSRLVQICNGISKVSA